MMVNREEGPKGIKLKYLTKGYTHNAADGIHGNNETKTRKKRKYYDFPDFVECVANGRKGVSAIELKNFRDWKYKKRTPGKKGFTPTKVKVSCCSYLSKGVPRHEIPPRFRRRGKAMLVSSEEIQYQAASRAQLCSEGCSKPEKSFNC
jgi:hypothetical protein